MLRMRQISPCVTLVWHSRKIPYQATHYEGLMEYEKPLWETNLPSFCGKIETIQIVSELDTLTLVQKPDNISKHPNCSC